ncbi:hypothetical protein D3C75_992530 [compost metagenome]
MRSTQQREACARTGSELDGSSLPSSFDNPDHIGQQVVTDIHGRSQPLRGLNLLCGCNSSRIFQRVALAEPLQDMHTFLK